MARSRVRLAVGALMFCAAAAALHAQFGMQESVSLYERKATLAKELGATHMPVTGGLPLATWEIDANDPYPMWFVHHAGMLTIFPPAELLPYVDAKYAANVEGVLKERCAVLGRLGLKGVWSANEPEVLPEAFFTAHPELRGPRIDQPNRSRKVYFAPNVDSPEMLGLYRESIQRLLKTCPMVEQFNYVTTDAGSGFDWAPSLYSGINGNSNYRTKPMADRVSGFLINLQQAARDAGHEIQINLNPIEARQWMAPTFSPDVLENTVRKLPRGLAVEGREGPDGRHFAGVGAGGGGEPFYPVLGIVIPSMNGAGETPARRAINLGDATTVDFNYRLLKTTHGMKMRTLSERMAALRAFAVGEVGEAQADNLVEAWSALNEVQRDLQVLNFGDVLLMGDVLNRWITRPMVPFPEELTAAEKQDYRPFLFQAKGETEADDLVDIQAMRMYEGWGAKMLFQRTIELTLPRLRRAESLVQEIEGSAKGEAGRQQWALMAKRLRAVGYLLESADDMVSYQAQLDRVKSLGAKPEVDPVLGVQSSWDRTEMMETARKEIDTMVNLNRLLVSTKEPILDMAPTPGEETIMRLGPDVAAEILHKVNVMNAHWRDYDRIFTVPNP
jgi:hypothetical protein